MQQFYGSQMHGAIEHLVTSTAQRFSPIHCRVSIAEQVFWPIVACFAEGNANADRGEDFLALQVKRRLQRLMNAASDAGGIVNIDNIFQENRELITA